ncbi:hypothetical protein H0N95_01750 [Candidatus Micrarchaeota archaeon]|nr:hypothetical protein [Candidatus Micrarchaeota archaeon]
MKTEIKVLIALVVMMLSVGPLSYFFGAGTTPAQIPYNESNNASLVTSFSGNVTGKIIAIKPYISYVGIADSNNETIARSVMDYVNYTSNYTLHVSLNPTGSGYRYELFVPLKNETDATSVGFKVKLNMDPFFASSYTTTMGSVQLPASFSAGGKTIDSGNKTALAVLLYSAKKGENAEINCPEFIVTQAGALVNNPAICYDTSQGYKYGLSFTDYMFGQKSVNKTMSVNVSLIDHAEIEGTFHGKLNDSQLRNETGQDLVVYNPASDNGTGTMIVYLADFDNATLVASVQNILKAKGIDVTRTSKIGVVIDVPREVELNGVMKWLYHVPYFTVRLGMSENAGMKSKEIEFVTVFGEVADVIAY